MLLDFAFPDLVAAEGVERVLVLATNGDGGDAAAIRDGEDDLGGAVVGADLDAALGGDELTAFLRVAEAFRTGVVVPILDVEVEEALFVNERAVISYLITVGPLRVAFGDAEEPLIGAEGHASGEFDASINLLLLAVLDEPDTASIVGLLRVVIGDVEAAVRMREDAVTEYAVQNDAGLARGVVAQELAGFLGDGVKRSIGSNADAVRIAGFFGENADLVVETDAVDFVGGGVGEEDFAIRGGGGSSSAFEAFGDEFPVLAREDDFLSSWSTGACFDLRRPVFPKVSHRLLPVLAIARDVFAFDDAELIVVARKLECFVHLLIDEEPVACRVFHVVRGGGEIRADRACFKLAYHRGKLMPTAKRHPTATGGIDSAEGLRLVPGRRESCDAAAAATDDAAIIAIGAKTELILLCDERQKFLVKEAQVVVADAVVFKVTITPSSGAFHGRRNFTGSHKDAHSHRHFLGGDGEFEVRFLAWIEAIGLHINAGGLAGIVLCWDEDRHFPHSAGEDFALVELKGLGATRKDGLGLDGGWCVSRRFNLLRYGWPTTCEWLDEPLQMLIARFVLPKIDFGPDLLFAAKVIEPHTRRVLWFQRIAAVVLPLERPELRVGFVVLFDGDLCARFCLTIRHCERERRLRRRHQPEPTLSLGLNDPFLIRCVVRLID